MKRFFMVIRFFCFLTLTTILVFPSLSVADVTINYFFIPEWSLFNNIQRVRSIIPGPDGNLWFGINNNPDAIGRLTLDGTFTIYPTPHENAYPLSLTVGPDGNIWFVEYSTQKIGRITPEGDFTEFDLPQDPNPAYSDAPFSITAGPDGNLWYTASSLGPKGNVIGQMTPAGGISAEIPLPAGTGGLWSITTGPDSNLWFTDSVGNNIGRVTLAGSVTLFPIPTANSQPMQITASPDGNLWFTEYSGNKIGRITPNGVITEYPVFTANSGPYGITPGPDGNIWFTESTVSKIGHTPISVSNEFDAYSHPPSITVGPDGNIWFASSEYIINQVTGTGAALRLRLMHSGNPVNTYSTFLEAYTAARTGDVIQAQAIDLTGPLTFTKSINVTLKGGYDSAFVLNTQSTVVTGGITIKSGSGKVGMEKVVIR
jgi:streptogramin lyase